MLSGAPANALAESESTLQSSRGGWKHLEVFWSTGEGYQSVWEVCVWLPDRFTFCWWIGDQPILCQLRIWRVCSYQIRVWCCNAYQLKPMSRVASTLLSSTNVIIPPVTSCLGRYHSLWPGSTLVVHIAWGNRPEVWHTRILTSDCCVCVLEYFSVQSNNPASIYELNVVEILMLGWSFLRSIGL